MHRLKLSSTATRAAAVVLRRSAMSTMAKAASPPSVEAAKRKADEHDPSISPPPIRRRKVQSNLSKSAVANFFTPTSAKPKDRVVWTARAPSEDEATSLLVAKYSPSSSTSASTPSPSATSQDPSARVAAFDLDSTLVTTASGKRHPDGPSDWKWWDRSVPERLRELHKEGYLLVIFSNQGGLSLHPDPNKAPPKTKRATPQDRVAAYKTKCAAVLAELDLPVMLYAATGKDLFRKPRAGMWDEMRRDLHIQDIDLAKSFFVGDAAGRTATNAKAKGSKDDKDFGCSDRNFAANVGLPFQTPDEFFLDAKPRAFARTFDLDDFPFGKNTEEVDVVSSSGRELLVFCGPPGAGKSSFFATCLEPLGYRRVNQDTLKSKGKCVKAAAGYLSEGHSVAIDNTNPDPPTRALWIDLAAKHNVPVRCIWFKTSLAVCEHNDAVRALNQEMNPEQRSALPKIAFHGFTSRFREPSTAEGFKQIIPLEFRFRGTQDEYRIWGRYWV